MTTKSVYDPSDQKLPGLHDLHAMATAAGVPKADVDAILPAGNKPSNQGKRELMLVIRDRLARDPALAEAVDFRIAGAAGEVTTSMTPVDEDASDRPTTGEGARLVLRRRVDDLRPNTTNGQVFSDSLSESGIELLAQDIERQGQRQPIEIMTDGTIIDGERRWRALRHLGAEFVDVAVRGEVTEQDLPGLVLDAYSSVRDATIEEMAKVFGLALEVLRARHGRPVGRPTKLGSDDPDFWSAEQITTAAARRAGFSSATLAKRAVRIFAEADDETKASVNAGAVTISAAHSMLAPPSASETPAPSEPPGTRETLLDDGPDPRSIEVENGAGETPETSSVAIALEPVPYGGSTSITPRQDQQDDGAATSIGAHAQRLDEKTATAGTEHTASDVVGAPVRPRATAPPAVRKAEQDDGEIWDKAWHLIYVKASGARNLALELATDLLAASEDGLPSGDENVRMIGVKIRQLVTTHAEQLAAADVDAAAEWAEEVAAALGESISSYRSDD